MINNTKYSEINLSFSHINQHVYIKTTNLYKTTDMINVKSACNSDARVNYKKKKTHLIRHISTVVQCLPYYFLVSTN